MFTKRREQTGDSEFLRHHLHRVVTISAVLRTSDGFRVWSLGDASSDEADLIRRFFDGIDRYTPVLVSWNGSGFDLPVLHYRALKHGIVASRYWETGAEDQSFRWNNYLSRYHERHTDLMDVLSGYQPRATAPLDEVAVLLGLPGKMGHSGAEVWDQFQAGAIEDIRNYCETDVLNTYLVYLRFELMRGNLDDGQYQKELTLVRDALTAAGRPHLSRFLSAWHAQPVR
jgi:predicted PolB exonuclease-like 3'-5' exonuclease